MGRIGMVVLGMLTLGAAAAAGFVWSFRTKYRPVQDRVRRFNRDVTNQYVLHRAGTPGVDEAVVHHVGRSTGTPYKTPVEPVVIDDGFVVGLPYGPDTDWVRNVLAAGGATLELDGQRHRVAAPEVVPMPQAAHWFTPADRRVQRMFGMDEVLVLHHATSATPRARAAGNARPIAVDPA